MNLKDNLTSHIKKANIPNLSDDLINKMEHVVLSQKLERRHSFLNPLSVFKLASMFFMILGVSLFIISNQNNQTYAFTQYDEVMMQASSTAYALIEETYAPIEEPVSVMEHLSFVRSELKTMVSYQYIFERLLSTNKPSLKDKIVEDSMYQIEFRLKDESNQEIPLQVKLEREYRNFKQDSFSFEGSLDDILITGETQFIDQYHQVKVILNKDRIEIKVSYDDETKTYQVKMYVDNNVLKTFQYQIEYDTFDRPELFITYEKDTYSNTFSLKRNNIRNIIEIAYEIKNDSDTYKGDLLIQFKMMPSPRYDITLNLESGETFQYQFLRPIRTQNEPI